MREEVATIIAKIPKGDIGITDPVWHEMRMELARPKADEILDYFEEWLRHHSNLGTVMLFQDERER